MTDPESPVERSKREILFVIGQLQVGGTEMHLTTIAPRLKRLGWRVRVFCLKDNGPLRAVLEREGVPVLAPSKASMAKRSNSRRLLMLAGAAWSLLRLMLRRRPAIVHFFLPESYLVGAPLAALARLPVRVMSRRSLNLYQKRYPGLPTAERLLHRSMTAILGNSRSVVDELLDSEGVPAARLGLIYNGVAATPVLDPASRTEIRASLGVSPTALTMVIVANLIPYKGHRDLIEALGSAKRSLPQDWNLLVVGDDRGIGGELKARAGELGIANKILFLGERDDVRRILSASDIGLLVSHEEGFSNAVLEGMSAGLPMIVTNVGGNAEAVLHNRSGLVVSPRDPAGLADAILRLAKDPELRDRFGREARHRVAEKFSIEQMIALYDELYRALLLKKRPCDLPQVRI